jgi:processive 1,2-diacylglycerol beta-glucosyltransferase
LYTEWSIPAEHADGRAPEPEVKLQSWADYRGVRIAHSACFVLSALYLFIWRAGLTPTRQGLRGEDFPNPIAGNRILYSNGWMKVLIATVTAGAGHLQAAAALEENWKEMCAGDEVRRVDLMEFVPRLQRKIYTEGYVKLIEHAPELYAMVFKKTDNPALMRRLSRFRRAFAAQANRGFVKLLKSFDPDLLLAPHFLPLEVLGGVSEDLKRKPFTVCIVTDFEAHSLWLEESADLYCVAAEETRASLIARGVKPDAIVVTGIPISKRFSKSIDPDTVRKQFGWRDDLPIVLVLGGGFGMGPVAEILEQMDKIATPLQAVVIAGRNEDLRMELAAQQRRWPTDVLGFVSNMEQLMAVASLLISKPGGLTTSEALVLGKPLLIVNPIPGQETANSDFLLEHGAAIKVNRIEDIAPRLEQLLTTTSRLAELQKAAQKLGRKTAAGDICKLVRERQGESVSRNQGNSNLSSAISRAK